jgi:dTDP-4-amino-4,6-dideoxygalactose transaminase
LQKLHGIAENRRQAMAMVVERISDLQAIRPGKIIDGANPTYWFAFLRVYPERLRVPKEQVAAALRAEGIPVGAAYDAIVPDQIWIRERRTYGNSQCPWVCPYYGKEVSYEGTVPNAHAAVANHMTLSVHECYGPQEAEDIAKALHKVEAAYLK